LSRTNDVAYSRKR